MALIAFLRGVNVGGYRTFRPSLLASQLQDYGVVNIGAAGTFVVRNPVSQTRFVSELRRRLPFETEVMLCTARQLITAASAQPFQGQPAASDVVRFVSVLPRRPHNPPSLPLRLPATGKWLLQILSLRGRFVFGLYRREMKAISALYGMDKLFGMPLTTRNWNTIASILDVLNCKHNS
ncbi:MAG TPA: DUF1697 domain-containing protein [Terriglobales bacterium]|nr:DUF1697 domain-containing protein [Terriglobales bacterium]